MNSNILLLYFNLVFSTPAIVCFLVCHNCLLPHLLLSVWVNACLYSCVCLLSLVATSGNQPHVHACWSHLLLEEKQMERPEDQEDSLLRQGNQITHFHVCVTSYIDISHMLTRSLLCICM